MVTTLISAFSALPMKGGGGGGWSAIFTKKVVIFLAEKLNTRTGNPGSTTTFHISSCCENNILNFLHGLPK